MKYPIQSDKVPAPIGTYSQAIKAGNTIYFSGQIPLDPVTKELVTGDITQQTIQVFENLKALAEACGGNLDAIVKINIYLTNLVHFPLVNETMAKYFRHPFPARSTLGVQSLPKGAEIEIDAVMVLF